MTALFDLRNSLRNLACTSCSDEKNEKWAFDIKKSCRVFCEDCWDYTNQIIPLKIDKC